MSDLLARRRRSVLLAAASVVAIAMPAMGQAQTSPDMAEHDPQIVVNDTLNPNAAGPGGALDTGINGIGQMIAFTNQGLGLCSGSLINPRTVIFAAHCVNSRPADQYGSQTGSSGGVSLNSGAITAIGTTGVTRARVTSTGVPLSFGFGATNRCLATTPGVNAGTATIANPGNGCQAETGAYEKWRNGNFATVASSAIFNVNQVWYDTRSLEPASVGFLYADVAIATLDTPASDIPTWTTLFSPLTGPTHGIVTGYGVNGTHTSAQGGASCPFPRPPGESCRPIGGIDYRRRAAENMIDVLASLDDNDEAFFPGSPFNGTDNPQALYQTDFDSPGGPATFNGVTNFDIDLFDGAALPNEATTAGGDSGGPLIADQAFARPTIVGVLSGGSRYFNEQRFSTYGTTSFYQPLFLYWEEIVTNNPYVYASAKTGSGSWFDPTRWVQDMDPAYQIAVEGALVNGLPGFRSDANAGNGPRFGTLCNGPRCVDLAGTGTDLPTVPPFIVPGGPGSTNFVPNNIAPVNSANPALTVKARYYDVMLRNDGITVLDRAATIDKLTIAGPAQLFVTAPGNLTVLGDYTQGGGLLSVNGTLKTGEALISRGQLVGSGTFDPTFLTVLNAAVLPGGSGGFGTLTIKGDLILTSATLTQLDVNRTSSDKLVVTGDAQNPGIASLGGLLFVTKAFGANPRDGQAYEILTATGGIDGTFNTVQARIGNLRGSVAYNPNNAVLTFNAGRLAEMVGGSNPASAAFANALDSIRTTGYTDLAGLYGAIDVMESAQLTATLSGLTPRVAGVAQLEADEQRSMVLGMVSDRLSMIGTSEAQAGTFSVIGAPETLGLAVGQTNVSGSSASLRSIAGNVTANRTMGALPENVSGFIAGGYDAGRAGGTSANGQRGTWHIAMGLEMAAAPDLTIGTAFGYVNGRSNITGSQAETRTSQAVAYGSYRLSRNAYLAGMASVTHSDIGVQRGVSTGLDQFSLNGATSAMSYDLHMETGYNVDIAKGLTFTPRAALRYSSTSIDGYRERGGEAALLIDDISDRRLEARFGARMSGSVNAGSGWAFAPELAVDQVQALSRDGSELQVRFAQAAGIAFTLPGLSRDRSWTEVKGGMKLTDGTFSFGAGVESSLGRSDYRDNRAVASFGIKF